ncbi:MAG: DnaJ domain-containing protein [Candidatus Omnitrophota bacterium]
MTDHQKTAALLEFESAVNAFFTQIKKTNPNYYELLGISTTATQREIEAAYKEYSQEFSPASVALIADPELQKKAQFLIDLGKRAHDVLTDFDKRAQYEKLEFRDVAPESLKELEPGEKAREIYKKAKALYNQKNFSLAVKAMEEAIAFDPHKPDYYHLLGLCQTQIPEWRRKAEVNLKKAAEMETWNAEHQVALGMLFYSEKLYKRAESYFRKALEIEPNHTLAGKKLLEIAGPEKGAMDKIQDQLGKYLPTFFGKKKK